MTFRHRSLLVALAIGLSACSGFSDPDAVSEHVGRVTGVDYRREGGLTVGASALRLARVGVSASGEETPALLRDLKDVQVGVYRPVAPDGARAEPSTRIPRLDDFRGYEPVVAMEVERGEEVLLLSRSSRGRIRELLAVILGDELLVVQVRGDLEDVLEQVVRLAFARAERDDLTDPVLDSLTTSSSPP